ncbi:hypothetical protein E4U21_006092 [Claviceps maximensis]|nr:hypothetical protein E4U21_006092 [Claviceps maximensis]
MLSSTILFYLALSVHAAPAKSAKHAHQAIHLKRLDMDSHDGYAPECDHAHIHARAYEPVASAYVYDGIAPNVAYSSMHVHREGHPEWARKRL